MHGFCAVAFARVFPEGDGKGGDVVSGDARQSPRFRPRNRRRRRRVSRRRAKAKRSVKWRRHGENVRGKHDDESPHTRNSTVAVVGFAGRRTGRQELPTAGDPALGRTAPLPPRRLPLWRPAFCFSLVSFFAAFVSSGEKRFLASCTRSTFRGSGPPLRGPRRGIPSSLFSSSSSSFVTGT